MSIQCDRSHHVDSLPIAHCAVLMPVLLTLLVIMGGCGGSPSKANIELRKQNQELRDQVVQLQSANQAAHARITAFETQRGTLPTLPTTRLAQLFTVHAIKIGRLSGGSDSDPNLPGDELLKVYVAPVDAHGDILKAAGDLTVEAFDLSEGRSALIGRWSFPADQCQKLWYDELLLQTYVLPCPWQRPPQSNRITVRVTFLDTLTQRLFEATAEVRVVPPPHPVTAP